VDEDQQKWLEDLLRTEAVEPHDRNEHQRLLFDDQNTETDASGDPSDDPNPDDEDSDEPPQPTPSDA
jgi:hypothetical protein